ncbi:MAG: YgjV family protein [Clostridium sp.]|nr:YgjV family protein [Clostridium sp.]
MYYIIAQAIGFLGMGLYIISYQFKGNRWLMVSQLASCAAYAVHFFMLGAYTGCALQLVSVLNYCLLVYSREHKEAWATWGGWKWVISAVFIGSTVFTWKNALDILPCMGSVSTTIANWTRNGKTMRLARLFISGPGWLIYDAATRSYSGVLCEVFGIVSVLVSIWRYGLKALDQKD